MHSRRRLLFNSLCALSLLIGLVVGILWHRSFTNDWQLFGLTQNQEQYKLLSKSGQFVLVGPPKEDESNPISSEVVRRMSNEDFEWSEIGSEYVCGAVRRGTPTWQVYQHHLARERRGMGLEPAMRIWIREAKDDPKRFVPAHMLFMFAAEQKRTKTRALTQRWSEIGFRMDADASRIPEVIMRADAQQKGPDFGLRWDLQRDWNDVMTTPRGALFHGWLFLGAMVMPLAWAARPRWRQITAPRWAFNWFALTLSLLCLIGTSMWLRSWFVDEQFLFAPRPTLAVPGWRQEIDFIPSIGSSSGELRLMQQDVPRLGRGYRQPWGYQRQIANWPTKVPGNTVTGEKSLKVPGVSSYEVPSQVVTMPSGPIMGLVRAAPVAMSPPTPGLSYGRKALSIRWWLIVVVSEIVPALWVWSALAWRRRIKGTLRAQRCLVCGYDLRATPGRCPECGSASAIGPLNV